MISKIVLLFLLLFIPLQASDEPRLLVGQWYVVVTDGSIGKLYHSGKKGDKCYLQISNDFKTFKFGSVYKDGYAMEATMIQELE